MTYYPFLSQLKIKRIYYKSIAMIRQCYSRFLSDIYHDIELYFVFKYTEVFASHLIARLNVEPVYTSKAPNLVSLCNGY